MIDSGKLIKLLRTNKGIGQVAFAKKTGISSNYLSLIENGHRKPPLSYLQKAASALGVTSNIFVLHEVDLSKFKDRKSKAIAKRINQSLQDVQVLLTKELLNQ